MKQFFLFAALAGFTAFTSCTKQQADAGLTPDLNVSESVGKKLDAYTPMSVRFTLETDGGAVNELQNLKITNQTTNAVSYVWDFGNGQTSTAATPEYRYPMHGYYTIRLKATDARGQVKEFTRDVAVLCIFGGGDHEF